MVDLAKEDCIASRGAEQQREERNNLEDCWQQLAVEHFLRLGGGINGYVKS